MNRFLAPLLGACLAVAAAACDFDAAFARYCQGNAACETGGGGGTGGGNDGGGGGSGGGGSGGGEPASPRSCSYFFDCRPGEVCLPAARVCARRCESVEDCPDGLDACEPVADSWPLPEQVCTCRGPISCAKANPGTTCSPMDRICEPRCAGDADCAGFSPPRVCDGATGVCLGCRADADCPNAVAPRCDFAVHRCAGCLRDENCAGRADGRTTCSPRGVCVAP